MDGQREPPKNLKALLKFCMTVGDNYETTSDADVDPEKMEWLQEALNSMTVDVMKVMKDSIKTIVDNIDHTDADSVEKIEIAVEELQNLVADMDLAVDFVKIGGLELIPNLLEHPNASLRCHGGLILSELTQNHPFCQSAAINSCLVQTLLAALSKETDQNAMKQILSALSSLVRGFEPAMKIFMSEDGLSILLTTLKPQNNSNVKAKAAFMVKCLCSEDESIRDPLIQHGYINDLVLLLQSEHELWHEHVLQILVMLASHMGQEAIDVYLRGDPANASLFTTCLETRIQSLTDSAHAESVDAAKCLLKLLKK